MTLKTLQLSDSGLRVAYRDQGTGTPLFLIHGVGLQSSAWMPQIADLSAECRVIAVDMPGHGGSAPLPEGSLLPDFVDWARAVLDALGLRQVSIAGHSMGALIACGLTVSAPERVRRVALLNGVFRRDSAARNAVTARAASIKLQGIDIETPLARWFDEACSGQAAMRKHTRGWLAAMDVAAYETAYRAFAMGDDVYADDIENIHCPLLALTGSDDPNSTSAMTRAMADAAGNGRAVIVPEHRHMVHMTAAATVNNHLREWLELSQHAEALS